MLYCGSSIDLRRSMRMHLVMRFLIMKERSVEEMGILYEVKKSEYVVRRIVSYSHCPRVGFWKRGQKRVSLISFCILVLSKILWPRV